jgi:tetratricopeptide (TPR) repeat protein
MRQINMPWLSIGVLFIGICAVLNQSQPYRTHGCLWDRDTLAMEEENYPGIAEVITGRFERFPDLYYEMRLERVTKELESDPDNLDLYDDAGVACDRLGRCDKAIEWMTKKRAMLDTLKPLGGDLSEHEYRYLANLGTFHIHRWLKNGANRDDMQDAEIARDLIEKAIELNPDAHFGRERFQLMAIEWILLIEKPETEAQLFAVGNDFLIPHIWPYDPEKIQQRSDRFDPEEATHGLSGLIVLGNAWESIDIFHALAISLGKQQHAAIEFLCRLRVKELIENGRRSLHPQFPYEDYTGDQRPLTSTVYEIVLREDYFPDAREEANAWQTERQAFILSKLSEGAHPDTAPDFWIDYHESTSPAPLPGDDFWSRLRSKHPYLLASITFFAIVTIGIVGLVAALTKLTKKRPPSPA